jgi:hypothetical protein
MVSFSPVTKPCFLTHLRTRLNNAGFFNGGKTLLTGLTPGSTLWVRIQTAGLDGVMGAWSDPAKITVV